MTDKDGGLDDAQPVDVVVDNANPTAAIVNANGTVNEGGSFSFTATTSDVAADTIGYSWIARRNGVDYATGGAAAFSFVPNDNAQYEVSLTVTDEDGGVGFAMPVSVTAMNVAAIADASGETLGMRGEERTLTLDAIDPGALDMAAGFTYTVDWADGSPVETVLPGSGITELHHVYQQVGTFQVKVTAADKDRLPTDAPLVPQTVTMVSQGSALDNGVLTVSGSPGHDHLRLFRVGGLVAVGNLTSGGLEFVQTYTGTINRVIVVGGAGNDQIDASAFNVSVEIYGGAGDDRLTGGSAADILVGGDRRRPHRRQRRARPPHRRPRPRPHLRRHRRRHPRRRLHRPRRRPRLAPPHLRRVAQRQLLRRSRPPHQGHQQRHPQGQRLGLPHPRRHHLGRRRNRRPLRRRRPRLVLLQRRPRNRPRQGRRRHEPRAVGRSRHGIAGVNFKAQRSHGAEAREPSGLRLTRFSRSGLPHPPHSRPTTVPAVRT